MSSALFHAILCVAFLAVYILAGQVLIGARRQRRARVFRADGAEAFEPGWHCRQNVASHG